MVNSSLKVTRSGRFDSYPDDSAAVAPKSRSKRVKLDHNDPPRNQSLSNTASSRNHISDSLSNETILTKSLKGPRRPPSKISPTRLNGRLLRTVNGVQSSISIDESAITTPFVDLEPAIERVEERVSRSLDTKAEDKGKRILRSQDGGSRSRSDLVHFFPDYEDVVFGDSKEPDSLNVDSTLFIVDYAKKGQTLPIRESPNLPQSDKSTFEMGSVEQEGNAVMSPATYITLAQDEVFKFGPYQEEAETFQRDPLQELFFIKAHKRGERKEKQLRNIEKEHAMHEKLELERLFDELRGPDWLRTMGISGVTDTAKKDFEGYRDVYIHRVKGLIDKFSTWREQEKELKLRSDRIIAAREEAEAGNPAEFSDQQPPNANEDEVDPSARQLLQEAKLASGANAGSIKLKQTSLLSFLREPEKPFTSFFSSPHLRETAIGKHRRSRSVLAFGHPVPNIQPREFALPRSFITEEALTANARKRRRLKRQLKVEGK